MNKRLNKLYYYLIQNDKHNKDVAEIRDQYTNKINGLLQEIQILKVNNTAIIEENSSLNNQYIIIFLELKDFKQN